MDRLDEQQDADLQGRRSGQGFPLTVNMLRSTDYLENIKQGAMNLLGNHLLNFGNTLTMAVKSEKNLDVRQTRSGEIDKEQDEEDARDHTVLSIQTKQFSTVQQQSAKNDETSARKRN